MQGKGGIGHAEPGLEIVRAVDDHVAAGEQAVRVRRIDPQLAGDQLGVAVETGDRGASGVRLGRADLAVIEKELALEVRPVDPVIVDDRQPADAGGSEILDDRGSDSARADDCDVSGEELFLPLSANLFQDDVTGVAVELLVGQVTNGRN